MRIQQHTLMASWLSFGFVVLSSIGVGVQSWLSSADPLAQLAALWFDLLIIPTLAGVGALIVAHRPHNRVGLLLLIPALVMAFVSLAQPYLAQASALPVYATPLLLFLVWATSWSWIWLIFPLLLILQLFPSGSPLSPRWRIVASITLGWAGLFVLFVTFAQQYATVEPPYLELVNPFGVLDTAQLGLLVTTIWVPGLLILTGLSTLALGLRYRRAGAMERAQIAWLLAACMLFALVYIIGGILGIGGESTVAGQIYDLLFGLTVLAIPLAIGIAILRYQLFDIAIIIRRTLIYAVLTIMLVGTYFLCVIGLQALFVRFTGQESTLAVVASTLTIAALFQPLRLRVQQIIDRRFFRQKYDAERVLAQFAQRAQQEADLDAISADLLTTVQTTREPAQVELWLVRGRDGKL
jgi:hypothetical protein